MNILLTYAIAALVPLLVGFVWFNPKVFGAASMSAAGISPDGAKGMNMPVVFIVTYILGFFLAAAISVNVVHQFHLLSLAQPPAGTQPSPAAGKWFGESMGLLGHSFRTAKHGALHGTIFGITALLPIVAINAMFERRGFKYIAINGGYWIVCSIIMGAFICHFISLPTTM